MNTALVLKSVGAFLTLYWAKVQLWVVSHQSDFAALIKLAETGMSDGNWTVDEKKEFKKELVERLILCDLPWYIPRFIVEKAVNSFIEKAIAKAAALKDKAAVALGEVKPK